MYGVKPACLCAHFHSGGRLGATVGLLPLVPLGLGGRGPRTLALGACRSGSGIQVMSLHCANMNQWSVPGSVGAIPVQGEFWFSF